MPLKLQPPLSHVLGEVTSPCRNQCFINNKIEEVRSCSVAYWALTLCLYRARLALLGMKLTLTCSTSSLKYHLIRRLVILQSYALNLVMR